MKYEYFSSLKMKQLPMIAWVKYAVIFLVFFFGQFNQIAAFHTSQEVEVSLLEKEITFGRISSIGNANVLDSTIRKKFEKPKNEIIVVDSVEGTSTRKTRTTKKKEATKSEMRINIWEVRPMALRKDVAKYSRNELGNSVSINSYAINNQFSPNTIVNMVSFNIYDKKLNVHSFSGTQSNMFPLNFTYENNVNTKLDLFGFEYRYRSSDVKKFKYSGRARLEKDNENRTYYQFGLGTGWKRETRNHTLETEHFPVRSGPGHILKIYRTQLASYNEFQLNTHIKQIVVLESNYYSDQQLDATLVSRTEYGISLLSRFKVVPLIELGYGEGTIDRRDSYPYWMAKRRVFGGGGVAFSLGSEHGKFQIIADASLFGEIDQASFERYTGNLRYKIKNFTTLHAGFEVYTIENFYSNVAQLGMVYNFK